MSGLLAQYTPLESLLLFQSLACYGVDALVFARVSDLLHANPAVRHAPAFDKDRLNPDALRDLYLRLLKDEVRDERHGVNEADAPSQNGDGPASRKRKAPSPALPTVQDAAQHAHLLPALITKLYARYRRQAVEEIREEERRYDRFNRELSQIQRGEWDDRFRRETNASRDGAQALPSAAASPASAPGVAPQDAQGPVKPPASLPQTSPPGSQAQSPKLPSHEHRRSSTKIKDIIDPPSNAPTNGSASPRKKSAPSPHQAAYAPPQPSGPHRTPSQPHQANARLPPHQQPPQTYSTPYGPPQTSPSSGPSGSPTSQSIPHPPAAHPILPVPPGMPFVPPPMQVPSMPESNGPFRPSSGSPHQNFRPHPPAPPPGPSAQSPVAHHPPPHVQPSGGFYPQYPGPHPYPPPQQQQVYYQQPPRQQQGGYMLPPFQVAPQDPVRAHQDHQRQIQQQQQAAAQPPSRPSPRVAVATPARSQAPGYRPHTPAPPATLPPSNATPATAYRRVPPLQVRTPFGSWKSSLLPTAHPHPLEWNPTPVSPISPPASPVLPPAAAPSTTTKSKRPVKSNEMPAPDPDARSARFRKTGRKVRGASVASSAVTGSVRGRTRSQSIASHVEEPSMDVKAEPSTPAETMESDAQSTTEATPSSGGRRTRRLAGTLQSMFEQPQGAMNKRKRDLRDDSETVEPEPTDVEMAMGTPGPSNFVVASRNFGRMSVPVMNDITSHKHASLFSNPVKAKDAEGYHDIIRRPQDLKSIRTAITNGSRAVAAATASTVDTPSAGSPGQMPSTPTQFPSTSTHITLPISEDLVPPKGIVNSAQLEKELMRMFANAVMFNSGVEGVVGDAVEMAKDVEASVANWRAAERTSSVLEGPGAPDDGERDDGGGGGGKRRKI